MNIPQQISTELNIKTEQITSVLNMFSEGSTVPFIARYRKEQTGGLDEDILRNIEDRNGYLTLLEERKVSVLKSIEEQGKLTEELKEKINASLKLQEVEDLYLPYRPKRKTRAVIAKEKGLEPLALFIINERFFKGNFDNELEKYINEEKGVLTKEDALNGAKDIIAEIISDSAEVRQAVRENIMEFGKIVSSKNAKVKDNKNKKIKDVYDIYHEFEARIKHIKPHQILAINRGEKEGFLKVVLSYDYPKTLQEAYYNCFDFEDSFFLEILKECVIDSFDRLIYPAIERDIRNNLTEIADIQAIEVFASNLRQLLLQPPIANKNILGIDPGFASGSKAAAIDSTGKYLEGLTIYPNPPQNKKDEAKSKLYELITKHKIELIAIGNGTASRETEAMVVELIKEKELNIHYMITNEAGASVYSASPVAKSEFPDLDAAQRGNISIARRVLDPLAELVKIEPKSIGVGLYQHDVEQNQLSKKLEDVVVSCVNYVGVDVNTASVSLLNYVSGLNRKTATAIVKHREKIGKFSNRNELREVSGIGDKTYEQAIGFLKIPLSENPFDNTFIHPESYLAAQKLLEISNADIRDKSSFAQVLDSFVENSSLEDIAKNIEIGLPTLQDIIENLKKPGRDPREDMPKPILRSDLINIEDIKEGMLLKGTVRNIVDFGVFVDIGLKNDALIHISQLTESFIKHPLEVLNVSDIIDVKVLSVDSEKGRVSLTMKGIES